MTAQDEAVKAAAEAIRNALGISSPAFMQRQAAEAAVAAAAPILLAAEHARAEALAAEVERLSRWKAEAMTVLSRWEAVYDELGQPGPLGESKAVAVLAAVRAKQAWIDGAKVDLDGMDEQTLTLTATVAATVTALEKEEAKVAFLSRELHDWSHKYDAARASLDALTRDLRALCDRWDKRVPLDPEVEVTALLDRHAPDGAP